MMKNPVATLLFPWLFFLGLAAQAAIDVYTFDTEGERHRFDALVQELRCPKCQNQNVADSSAPLAKDVKDRVYQQVREGKTDQEITDYLVARYGDFVTYRPPLRLNTLLLWLGPLAILGAGFLLLLWQLRARNGPPACEALSDDEKKRLADLLDNHQKDGH